MRNRDAQASLFSSLFPVLFAAAILSTTPGCGGEASERHDVTAHPVEESVQGDEEYSGDFEEGSEEKWSEPATETTDEPGVEDVDETPPT